MNEAKMKELVAAIQPASMDTDAEDEYCTHDVETQRALIELKHRRGSKKYPDSMIERKKFDNTMAKCEGKEFHYIVASDAHQCVFFFNVSKLHQQGVDFGWHSKRCPKTSDFGKRVYIEKEVGGLKWDDAYHVMTYAEAYQTANQ